CYTPSCSNGVCGSSSYSETQEVAVSCGAGMKCSLGDCYGVSWTNVAGTCGSSGGETCADYTSAKNDVYYCDATRNSACTDVKVGSACPYPRSNSRQYSYRAVSCNAP
ncbi:MAG: hypothetical protein AABY03_01785, partial [Nanoarchaeota archaeon]